MIAKRVFILVVLLFWLSVTSFASYKVNATDIILPNTITESLLTTDVQDKLNSTGGVVNLNIIDKYGSYTYENLKLFPDLNLRILDNTAEIFLNHKVNNDLEITNLSLGFKQYPGTFEIIDDFDYATNELPLIYYGSAPTVENRFIGDSTDNTYNASYFRVYRNNDVWLKFAPYNGTACLLNPQIGTDEVNTLEVSFMLNVGDFVGTTGIADLQIYFKNTTEVDTTLSNAVFYTKVRLSVSDNKVNVQADGGDSIIVDKNSEVSVSIRFNQVNFDYMVFLNGVLAYQGAMNGAADIIKQIYLQRTDVSDASNFWNSLYINDFSLHYYLSYNPTITKISKILDYAGTKQDLITFDDICKFYLSVTMPKLSVPEINSDIEITGEAKVDQSLTVKEDSNFYKNLVLNDSDITNFSDDFESGVDGNALTTTQYDPADGIYDQWEYYYYSPVYTTEASTGNLGITFSNAYRQVFIKRSAPIYHKAILKFDAKVATGQTYMLPIILDSDYFTSTGGTVGSYVQTYIYTDSGNGSVRVGNLYISSLVNITDEVWHSYEFVIDLDLHKFNLYIDNVYCGQADIDTTLTQIKAVKIQGDLNLPCIDNVIFGSIIPNNSNIQYKTTYKVKNVLNITSDTDMQSDFRFKPYRLVIPVLSSAPSNPITGEIYFDTTAGALKVYDGSIWH